MARCHSVITSIRPSLRTPPRRRSRTTRRRPRGTDDEAAAHLADDRARLESRPDLRAARDEGRGRAAEEGHRGRPVHHQRQGHPQVAGTAKDPHLYDGGWGSFCFSETPVESVERQPTSALEEAPPGALLPPWRCAGRAARTGLPRRPGRPLARSGTLVDRLPTPGETEG